MSGEERRVNDAGPGPSERSGQAVAASKNGEAVFLWGGLNFTEETVYNDAWRWQAGDSFVCDKNGTESTHVASEKFILFWTVTEEWTKLHQLGDIPRSRNGHSLSVVHVKLADDSLPVEFLVLFGGAGPESGPLNDSFVALCRDPRKADGAEDAQVGKWKSSSCSEIHFYAVCHIRAL